MSGYSPTMNAFQVPKNENNMSADAVLLFATLAQRMARVVAMIARRQDSLLIEIAADSLANPQEELAVLLETRDLAQALGAYTTALFGVASALKTLEEYDYNIVEIVVGVVGLDNTINLGFLEAILAGNLSRGEEKTIKEIGLFFEELPSTAAELARNLGQITRYSNEDNVLEILSQHSRVFLLYAANLNASQHYLTAVYSATSDENQAANAKALVRKAENAADSALRESTRLLFAIVPELGLE
jgi:hypothetical protein